MSLSSFSSGGRPFARRASFRCAWYIAYQKKKPTRKSIPRIGTLSGIVATMRKFGSVKLNANPPTSVAKSRRPPFFVQSGL